MVEAVPHVLVAMACIMAYATHLALQAGLNSCQGTASIPLLLKNTRTSLSVQQTKLCICLDQVESLFA